MKPIKILQLKKPGPPPGDMLALLHLNGVAGSTTIVNEVAGGLAFVATGLAQLQTTTKQFGTAALYTNGSTVSDRIETTSTTVTLNGNFTISAWFQGAAQGQDCLMSQGNQNTDNAWTLLVDSTHMWLVRWSAGAGADIIEIFTPASYAALYAAGGRFTLEKVGSTIYLSVDGVLIGSAAYTDTPTGRIMFGARAANNYVDHVAGSSLNVDEVLIQHNGAKWGSYPFTNPTAEF